MSLTLWSCEKEDDESKDNSFNSINQLRSGLQNGQWQIIQFTQNGTDETADYTDYKFQFADDEFVTVSNDTVSETGFWSLERETSGSSEDDIELNFNFTDQQAFDEFNEDWVVTEFSSTLVQLEDQDSVGVDYLYLDKAQ